MTDRHGGFIRIKFGYVLAAIVATILVIVIVSTLTRQSNKASVSIPTHSPTVSSSTSATPFAEDSSLPDSSDLSDLPEPTKYQVWQFETAYNTPDPKVRNELLKGVATQQYLSANRDSFSKANSAVVTIDKNQSKMTVVVDDTRTSSYVVTYVVLNVSESGVSETTTLAPHGSFWINTSDGWKVAREAGEN